MFAGLISGLAKTRRLIRNVFTDLVAGRSLDDAMLARIEETLVLADVGMATVAKIIDGLKKENAARRLESGAVRDALKQQVLALFSRPVAPLALPAGHELPHVLLVVGVNGTGKTTTIGKLAHRFRQEGRRVLIAAADTFRAAAIEQLEIWAQRAQATFIKQKPGADPAAVAFDAVAAARAQGCDLVLVDTAGRLHTKTHLLEELKKIKRVLGKFGPDLPLTTFIVLDANLGQNSLAQVRTFNEAVPVDGIVLTKLDGTAKGGMVLTIQDQLGVPIRLIGVGEKIEDLRDFNAVEFVDALFAEDED
jgi:fused signal recognition particle receptor